MPRALDLVKALWRPESVGDQWTSGASPVGRFASGRWALAHAVERCVPIGGDVHVPAFICESAVTPLRRRYRLHFYQVDASLAPRFETIAARGSAAGALLLVHYFGIPSDVASASRFCQETGLSLIEDAAHVLQPIAGRVGVPGHLTVFSPRKLLPTPQGGLLVGLERPALDRPPATGYEMRWLGKRMLQAAWRGVGGTWRQIPIDEAELPALPPEPGIEPRTGRLTWRILRRFEETIADVSPRRRSNWTALRETLSGLPGAAFVCEESPECPFVLALRFLEPSATRLRAWRSAGLPASRWPDLPIEVRREPRYEEVVRLQQSIVTLPVHQGLTVDDMRRMGERLRRAS